MITLVGDFGCQTLFEGKRLGKKGADVNSTSGTYAITYTTNGNCPIDSTVNIAVGNDPIVNAISDQTKCEGVPFSTIAFTGNPGTVFDWTNTNTAIGLSASGTGDIQSFNASGTIAGASDISSTISVTPRMGSCIGIPKTFKLTVNALDNATFSYSNTSLPTPLALAAAFYSWEW